MLNATTPGATYLWDDGSTGPTRTVNAAGTYSVNVSANGCTGTDAITVAVTPLPVVNLGPDGTICAGDQLVLDASCAGCTYAWDDGSTGATRTVNAAGTYSVTVTAGGCTASDDYTLTIAPAPSVDLGPDLALCPGGSALLDATTAGAGYLWQDGSSGPSFTASAPGLYEVTVTIGSCTASDAIVVNLLPAPAVDLGNDTSLCIGASLVFDLTGTGTSVIWQDGSTAWTFATGTSGTLSATVTGANGCTATDDVDVVFTAPATVDLGSDSTLCDGNTLLLDASLPGAGHLWSTGSTASTLVASGSGTYWVEVSLGACITRDSVDLIFLPTPVVDLGPDLALCDGVAASFDVTTAGASYLWHDGSTGSTYTTGTTTAVSVTVSLGACTEADAVLVTFSAPPLVDLGPDVQVCAGAAVGLDATVPGATYLWQDGSTNPTYAATTSGLFGVVVELNGCTASDSVAVDVIPLPTVELGPDTGLCDGATLLLAPSLGSASALWSTGDTQPTITVNAPGSYWITATDGGCTASDTVTVTYIDLDAVDLGPDATLCPGGTVTFSVNAPGASVLWSDGSAGSSLTTGSPGVVVVTVTLGGCSRSDAALVTVISLPQDALGDDVVLCPGDTLVLTAPPGLVGPAWSDGTMGPILNAWSPDDYTLSGTYQGCPYTETVVLSVQPEPGLELGGDRQVCEGQQVLVEAVTGGEVVWSTGQVGGALATNVPGIYWAAVEWACGTVSDTVSVVLVECGPFIHVPNAFTPDGDGINEVFTPVIEGTLEMARLDLFDRWGELILTLELPDMRWDGTLGGTPAPDGVYPWVLTYKALTVDGVRQQRRMGHVTLLR